MNNFTKDELFVLIKCIRISEKKCGEDVCLDNLKFKLQKLIDNYCEDQSLVSDYHDNQT
jgi:hypothetical protein